MRYIIPLLATVLILFSVCCTNKKIPEPHEVREITSGETAADSGGSRWYYFSGSGIHLAANPADIPSVTFQPWTESIRVTDAAIIGGEPSFLINKLGLMTTGAGYGAPALHTDPLFSGYTAAGIYKTERGTAIRLYRNSFFSDSDTIRQNTTGICLLGYNYLAGTFSVMLTAADIGLQDESQCVALDRIGAMWYASFKREQDNQVSFSYLEFDTIPGKKLAPDTAALSEIKQITQDVYQSSVLPFPVSDMPDAFRPLMGGIPDGTSLNIHMYTVSSASAQNYVRTGDDSTVDGTACLLNNSCAVLYADGTFYYRPDNSAENVYTIRLPNLSRGYVYTNFILTGKKVIAAWEEQRFFETGRAGLLEMTLPDAIYSN